MCIVLRARGSYVPRPPRTLGHYRSHVRNETKRFHSVPPSRYLTTDWPQLTTIVAERRREQPYRFHTTKRRVQHL